MTDREQAPTQQGTYLEYYGPGRDPDHDDPDAIEPLDLAVAELLRDK